MFNSPLILPEILPIPKWSAVQVFLVGLACCVLTAGGHLYSPDEEIMYRVTESLATRASLDVRPIVDAAGATFATRKGVNGLEYAQYGIGNSLLAVPLYWIGCFACQVFNEGIANHALSFQTVNYVDDAMPGHGRLRRLVVSFLGSIITAATVMLLWVMAYSLAGRMGATASGDTGLTAGAVAWWTAAAYLLGTMALPHARTYFSEAPAAFFALLAFGIAGLTPAMSMRYAVAAGCAFAAALLVRLDSLLVLPALGMLLLHQLPKRADAEQASERISKMRRWIASRVTWHAVPIMIGFAVPIGAFALLHLSLNHRHFGNAFSSAYADQKEGINFSTPVLAGLYGFLMSVGKSIFLFSPALLLAFAGWRRVAAAMPALVLCLMLAAATKLLIHSTWQNWAGGWCWGPRHIFLIHPFIMVLACGYFISLNRWRRWLAELIILAGLLVQLYGCSQNFIDYYILYYRTPYSRPAATVLYSADDTAPLMMKLKRIQPGGVQEDVPFSALIAPINDSIYVPQNSQWYRYAEMWSLGYTDNLWLRLIQRSRGREPPIE